MRQSEERCTGQNGLRDVADVGKMKDIATQCLDRGRRCKGVLRMFGGVVMCQILGEGTLVHTQNAHSALEERWKRRNEARTRYWPWPQPLRQLYVQLPVAASVDVMRILQEHKRKLMTETKSVLGVQSVRFDIIERRGKERRVVWKEVMVVVVVVVVEVG